MTHRIAALFAGFITAILVMMMFISTSVRMHPAPEGVDLNDPVQRQAYQDSLPALAYLLVAGGTILGTLAGALGAAFMAKEQIPRICATVGGGMLVFTVMNLMNVKPPMWFAALTVGGVLAVIPVAIAIARAKGFDSAA